MFTASWSEKQVKQFVDSADNLIDNGTLLKTDKTSTVSKTRFNNTDIVIKRYNNKGFFYSFRNSLRSSRAKKSWQKSQILLGLNICTPMPLGYVVEKKKALYSRSYFVMEYCEIQIVHDTFLEYSSEDARWHDIINWLKELMDKLASHRITHGDLKSSNVFVSNDCVGILDLDAMIIHNNPITYRIKRRKDEKKFSDRVLPKDHNRTGI